MSGGRVQAVPKYQQHMPPLLAVGGSGVCPSNQHGVVERIAAAADAALLEWF